MRSIHYKNMAPRINRNHEIRVASFFFNSMQIWHIIPTRWIDLTYQSLLRLRVQHRDKVDRGLRSWCARIHQILCYIAMLITQETLHRQGYLWSGYRIECSLCPVRHGLPLNNLGQRNLPRKSCNIVNPRLSTTGTVVSTTPWFENFRQRLQNIVYNSCPKASHFRGLYTFKSFYFIRCGQSTRANNTGILFFYRAFIMKRHGFAEWHSRLMMVYLQ